MRQRTYITVGFFLLLFLLVEWRLFELQLKPNRYKKLGQLNKLIKEYVNAERGKIYDRHNRLLVSNQPIYAVYITKTETKAFDTTALARLLKIDKAELKKRIAKAGRYSAYKPYFIAGGYLLDEIMPLKEMRYRFPGISIRKKSIRKYYTRHGANFLGYLQEVGPKTVASDPFYERGDLIGVAGVEKYYEKALRGKKGVRYYYRDKFNRKTKSYLQGQWDTLPRPGKDLHLTVDIDLQSFIDSLMQNKHGAVVVLDPETGEILALVSAPSYNPELLSGRKRNEIITKLLRDKLNKPLFDRSLLGTYPPGSPFKLVEAAVGLQEGAITPYTYFVCHHGFRYGNRFMRCHCGADGPVRLSYAIPFSCNTYFSQTYLRILDKYETPQSGVNHWAARLKKFGLGDYLHYDLPVGTKGLIPDSSFYARYFGHSRWKSMNIISNGIGQGQVLVTPIQLANMVAAIVNKGYYITPHIAGKIGSKPPAERFLQRHETGIDSVWFDYVIRGMRDVYRKGTARWSQIPGIDMGGKTGTSENFVRINGRRIKLPDHSIFVAAAPLEHPKIVVSVFIENGGFGANLAAPIASLIIEKYLRGKISRKDLLNKVLQTDLTPVYKLKTYGPETKH